MWMESNNRVYGKLGKPHWYMRTPLLSIRYMAFGFDFLSPTYNVSMTLQVARTTRTISLEQQVRILFDKVPKFPFSMELLRNV